MFALVGLVSRQQGNIQKVNQPLKPNEKQPKTDLFCFHQTITMTLENPLKTNVVWIVTKLRVRGFRGFIEEH